MSSNETKVIALVSSSSTDFDIVLFAVGSTYLIVGIAGVIFNMLDAVAIILDRALLNNPFYYFILHLCIADTL
uniref:G-protein coupled receptors family 1 profile domain-containing protein n=1 Tax=Romanomermis culicivorax TaxID=13658 RepID=A0A915JBS0_ROMCU